jgi:predicted GIY-YIG superfamily endonuclease
MTAHAIYRQFDATDRLLYVGMTNNPKRRLAEHKCRAVWGDQIARVEVVWMHTAEEAAIAEAEAIRTERPMFNGGTARPHMATGDAMRDWMRSAGLTQYDLAAHFGVGQATFSKLLNGKARIPLRVAVMIEDMSEGAVPCRYWLFGANTEPTASTGPRPIERAAA